MREMRGKYLDEVVNISSKVTVAANADSRRAWLEQVAGINGSQVLIALWIKGHLRQDTYSQPQLNVSLDDIRIYGGKHDVGSEFFRIECLVDFRTARECEVISDDGILGKGLQRQFLEFEKRVTRWNYDTAIPLVAGEHHQVSEEFDRLGGDGDVCGARCHEFGYLGWTSLA